MSTYEVIMNMNQNLSKKILKMSKSVAEEIKFLDLCEVLEDVQLAQKPSTKYKILQKLFTNYKNTGINVKEHDFNADTSFFPLLQLLLPQLGKERSYGLNKYTLRRILSKILCLSKDSEDFKKLGSDEYDFADTAYKLLRKQFSKSNNLSIYRINEYLDSLAEKQDVHKDVIFLKLFQETSPSEQKWLIRIILKKLGLGVGESKILNIYHPNAFTVFNDTNSLLTMCNILNDVTVTVKDSEIKLFMPIRPMLLRRCDGKELFKKVTNDKLFIIEKKFDGERFQLHMENDTFNYFSRSGYNYTNKFGETYNTGIYTPLLKGVFNDHIKNTILDGEMVGWDRNTGDFGSKGMNFDVKNLSDTSTYQACFCVFDVLLLNSKLLIKLSLKDRLDILKDVFTPREGIIQCSGRTEAYSKQDIVKALNDSMDNNEEGIVFKDPNSTYVPNNRNGGWWKMKLEYFSGVMSDLDLIIMGGFHGKSNKIEGFVVGVINAAQKIYLSLAKVTTGLSQNEWEEIRKYLKPHWIKTLNNNYERYGLYFGKVKPDVWISPKKSCILLIRASELVMTSKVDTDFKVPYNLRFARIITIRFDKPCEDCLTLSELEELTSSYNHVQKLYKNHLQLEDIECQIKKSEKFKPKFVSSSIKIDTKISDILENREFLVLSGTIEWKIEDVKRSIKENGGKIVKMESDNTYCIIAGDKHIRLEYYKGSVDIVKLAWLENVLKCKRMRLYSPADMIYVSEKTRMRFLRDYDKYGDSYTEPATKCTLEYVFQNIKAQDDYICPLLKEIDEFHKEIKVIKQFNVFEGYRMYFDKFKIINNQKSDVIYDSALDELIVKFWKGRISSALTPNVNFIVIGTNNGNRRNELMSHNLYDANMKIVDILFLYKKINNFVQSNMNISMSI